MRSRVSVVLAGMMMAVGGALAGGCGAEEMGVVTVELDVFSGEPNPSWVLNPGQAHEAESRLRDLPAGQGGRPEGKLGYRGFLVAFQDCHGRTEAVQIGAGLVERAGEVFEDVRGAEAWLMRMAEDRGFGALLPEPR